jgi:uncharacterized membrane protein YhaH (DUF805 family)
MALPFFTEPTNLAMLTQAQENLMNFGDSIGETFFNYANFRDRAARAEYWWWVLFATVAVLLATALDYFVFYGWSVTPFTLVIGLAAMLPSLSAAVRRLHDTNRSGWWVFLPIGAMALVIAGAVVAAIDNPRNPLEGIGLFYVGVPLLLVIATGILLIVLLLMPGDEGNNRYGPNRYAGA